MQQRQQVSSMAEELPAAGQPDRQRLRRMARDRSIPRGRDGRAKQRRGDGGHDLLVTRSQELWGPVAFTYDAMGGAWSSETAGPYENNVVAGFMGAALRNVDTGAYVASVRHPCTGGCSGQREQVSMESTGEAGQKYTIDVIDNYSFPPKMLLNRAASASCTLAS